MSVGRVTPGGSRTRTPLILPRLGLMYNSYLFAGVDVSADWLDAARQFGDGSNGSPDSRAPEHRRFANTADGHDALCRWLTAAGRPAHVVTEASGVYGIDLALALYEAAGVEVMVLTPVRPIRP